MASNPITAPEVYDYFTLDGVKSPGLARITSGGERKHKWESMQSPGFGGAFTVFRGEEIATIEYQIELWTLDHFTAWETFVAKLRAGLKTRPPRSYAFVDHRLEHNEIKQVEITSIGAQEILGPTKWGYKLGLIEYRKPRPVGGIVAPKNDPNAARKAAVAAAADENKALHQQLEAAKAAKAQGG